MSKVTIRPREETYRRLDRPRREDESFSDVVDRLLPGEENPLEELVGFVDEDGLGDVRRESRAFHSVVEDRCHGDRG